MALLGESGCSQSLASRSAECSCWVNVAIRKVLPLRVQNALVGSSWPSAVSHNER